MSPFSLQVTASVVYIDTISATASGFCIKYEKMHCILTNHHVLPNKAVAARAHVSQTGIEYESSGSVSFLSASRGVGELLTSFHTTHRSTLTTKWASWRVKRFAWTHTSFLSPTRPWTLP